MEKLTKLKTNNMEKVPTPTEEIYVLIADHDYEGYSWPYDDCYFTSQEEAEQVRKTIQTKYDNYQLVPLKKYVAQ